MPLGPFPDAAGGMAAPVDPRRLLRLLQGGIGHLLPQGPDALTGPFLGQQRHALASDGIPVAHDQVHMRIVRVGPFLVDGREP